MFKKKTTKDLVQGAAQPEKPVKKPQKKKKEKQPKQRGGTFAAFFRSRIFYGGACMLLGLAVVGVGIPALRGAVAETVEILCFARDIQAGTQLTDDMLQARETSAYNLPENVLRVGSDTDVAGMFVTTDALAGDAVTGPRLSAEYPGKDPSLAKLPEGKLAISVSLPTLALSVSGKLRQGDVIQIFSIPQQTQQGKDTTAQAPDALRYVEVLAVTTDDGGDVTDADKDTDDNQDVIATVTLLANEAQAQCLAELEQTATLHAALAVRGDDARKAAALTAQELLLTQMKSAETPQEE